jgi:hypothetical protein
MSDERESKLLLRAEALVSVAPLKEPNWDTFAARIEKALAEPGATDDSLLRPPLPESVEDGVEGPPLSRPAAAEKPVTPAAAAEPARAAAQATAEPVAPPESAAAVAAQDPPEPPSSQREGALAELARAAIARRGTKEAVDLAKASLAIAAQGRGAGEPAQAAPAPAEPSIVVEQVTRTVPPARQRRAAFDTRGPWIGVGVAAIGLAAGFGLYLRSESQPPQIVQLPATEVPQAPATVAPKPLAAEPARPATPAVTPDMLPAERGATAASEPHGVAAADLTADAAPQKAAASAGGAHALAATSSAVAARPEKVVLEEDRGAKGGQAKASSSAGMRPAEFNANGGVADRPTTGAAQAAVGAVLGAARSCIAGQPQASGATLQFSSSGEVTGVSVTGPAQGTPAAACIQSALKKARVQPFAAPTFSLAVTVRPP